MEAPSIRAIVEDIPHEWGKDLTVAFPPVAVEAIYKNI